MEEKKVCDKQQVIETKAGASNAGTDSAWIRRHLRDSIYLWACGEKADDEEDAPKLSDRLIGWLILFMQGFAYATLIVLAGRTSKSDTDASGESGYLLPSVTGAMYLLVASTTHDLRAGFSLLVDGSRAGHRAFGLGLLIEYGIMLSAAMTVLVSTSDDSAAVVLNAVTVLFIADLDEKALKFLSTVPNKWRLFWAIESIGISFALALVAIFYMGDDSTLLEEDNVVLQTWPTWFIWMLNPAGVTLASLLLSSTLQAVCEFCTEACASVDEPTVGVVVRRGFMRLFEAIKRTKDHIRGEPCFYVTLVMWLAQELHTWLLFMWDEGFPIAFYFLPATAGTEDKSIVVTGDKLVMLYSNAILVTGLAAKAWGIFQRRHDLVPAIPDQPCSVEAGGPREGWGGCAGDRVTSLLVGWGIGYWIDSLLYVLCCSWHGSECRWYNPPSVVRYVSYVVVPSFAISGIFMVADRNFLGARFGALVKPAVDIMINRRRVEYWIMATVFKRYLVLWMGYVGFLGVDFYS